MQTLKPQIVQTNFGMNKKVQSALSTMLEARKEEDPMAVSVSEVGSGSTTIHSGHFMISRVHDNASGCYDDDDEELAPLQPLKPGFNFDDANQDTCKTYSFGPRSTHTLAIDASLSTLFEHMTLAYSGKITSPKWKQFRGMHLKVKDKIRLNNIIWREWHMQYVFGMHPIVCQFATPLHGEIHTKPEAIVLEGYYWKRRFDTITEEYKIWRKFFKQQRMKNQDFPLNIDFDDLTHEELLDRVGEVNSISDFPRHQQTSNTDLLLNSRDLTEMMDLSDSLFMSLNQPFAFPNPREMSGFGYGDFIQPGLLQLQPNLEDFMELDPLQDMLSSRSIPTSGSTPELNHVNSEPVLRMPTVDVDMSSSPRSISSPQMVPSPQIAVSPGPHTPGQSPMFESPVPSPSPGLSDNQMIMDTDNFILNHLQMLQQQNQIEKQKQLEKQKQAEKQKQLEQQKRLQQRLQQQQAQQQRQQQQAQQQAQQQLQKQQAQQQAQQQLQKQQQAQRQQQQQQQAQRQQQQQQQQQSQAQQQQQQQQNNQIAMLLQQNSNLKALLLNSQAQPAKTSNNNALLTNLIESTNVNVQAPRSPEIVTQKPKPSVKIGTSILAALTEDENQSAINRLLAGAQSATQNQKRQFSGILPKKDNAGFTIPRALPVKSRGKQLLSQPTQRVIAPAPSPATTTVSSSSLSSLSQQNSYLAQLLTTGTYPGAIINVKEEGTSVQPVLPTTSVPTQQNQAPAGITIPITDFPTSLLIAAASHAFSPSQISVKDVFQNVSRQATSTTTDATVVVASPTKPEIQVQSPPGSFNIGSIPSSPVLSPTNVSFDESLISLQSPESSFGDQQTEEDKSGSKHSYHHISAEKKRRCHVKTPSQIQKGGFDLLHTLIPSISQNPNAKVSKAAMLQKTAEYCKKLKSERSQMQNEADILKQEISSLNSSISICQSQLPATGVPVTRQRADQMKEMFEEYVKQRTLTNWKFWIFSLIIRPLFDTFNTMVSTASVDELCRTVLAWLDQHCSLPSLRPIAANAMRHLSTTTSILSDPARVPEQAAQAVIKKQRQPDDKR